MKLLQKIEFWLFSVPALVISIGAIAHYGVWRVLWVFPIGYTLASVVQFSKGMVYEVLDGPRTNACRNGKWAKAFGLVMLFPMYNWFVAAAFVDCVNLLIVWRCHGTMPLPFVYGIVYTVGFAVAASVRALRGTCDGGYGELLIEAERVLLLAAIPVSEVVNLTLGIFALAMVTVGVVVVAAQGVLWYKKEHQRFMEYWEAEKRGQELVMRRQRKWFPRPGVVYEPDQQPTGGLAAKVSAGDWAKCRASMTVLRVSPVAFLSIALLLGGAAVLIDRGRGLVLFTGLLALVLWFLHSAFTSMEKWDTWMQTFANGAPHGFCYFWLGAMIVWFGTENLVLQIATAAFLVGCFEFPARFIVRGSSERNPDTLRIFATIGAVTAAIGVMHWIGAAWWFSGLIATVTVYPLIVARHFWPVKPLTLPNGANAGATGAVSGDPAKKDRRDRKRERQMAAFRRSQRG